MTNFNPEKRAISENGFAILSELYSPAEITALSNLIGQADTDRDTFRKSEGLFAIRQFLKEIPEVVDLIFNESAVLKCR